MQENNDGSLAGGTREGVGRQRRGETNGPDGGLAAAPLCDSIWPPLARPDSSPPSPRRPVCRGRNAELVPI